MTDLPECMEKGPDVSFPFFELIPDRENCQTGRALRGLQEHFLCLDRVGASFRIIPITFVSVASEKMLFFTMNPITSCTFER